MPASTSILKRLKQLVEESRATNWHPAPPPQLEAPVESKMLQGMYRGYAGERGTVPVQYHGGTYVPGEPVTRPLYTTRNPEMAQSYADVKGGSVVKLAPRPSRTASPRTLEALAAEYVPENAASGYTPASALDSAMHGERAVDRLTYELQRNPNFYDSARGFDIGFAGMGRGAPEGEALIMLPGTRAPAASAEPVFLSPQRQVAEYYARKRAAQTAEPPHVEMVLIDPASGRAYRHGTMGSGAQEPLTTMARKVKPEDVVESTELYARGGLAQLKECSCHG